MNASKELSRDYNNSPVGEHGANLVAKLVSPDENKLTAQHEDGVSEELSEASATLGNHGLPDKGLFEASKP